MEPPRPLVPRRPGTVDAVGALTLAASAAAAAAALLSMGDAFAVALLLAVLARRPLPAATAFLVAGAVLVRWGSSSLASLAGAQAVFGPAVAVGSGAEAASAALAALALLSAVPAYAPSRGQRATDLPATLAAAVPALPFGLLAAAVAAGPAYAGSPALRVAASAVGVAAAVSVARWGPPRLRQGPAVAMAGLALALAAAG